MLFVYKIFRANTDIYYYFLPVGKKQYLCSNCPDIFFTQDALKNHIYKHNHKEEIEIQCEHCPDTFSEKKDYRTHCVQEHGEIKLMRDQIQCKSCEMVLWTPSFYIKHHQKVHGSLPPDYSDKELFFCDMCPQVYISYVSLRCHMGSSHLNKKKKKEYKCQFCEKVFKQDSSYKEHIMVKHEKKKPFNCNLCTRSYGTIFKLRIHKKLVHEPARCNECGKDICNSFTLKRHKANVHGIKPSNAYCCEHCPLFYENKMSLDNHIAKQHAGI